MGVGSFTIDICRRTAKDTTHVHTHTHTYTLWNEVISLRTIKNKLASAPVD